MKLTMTVTFDPMAVNAKDIKAALTAAGVPEDAITMGRGRERAPKAVKPTKAER